MLADVCSWLCLLSLGSRQIVFLLQIATAPGYCIIPKLFKHGWKGNPSFRLCFEFCNSVIQLLALGVLNGNAEGASEIHF